MTRFWVHRTATLVILVLAPIGIGGCSGNGRPESAEVWRGPLNGVEADVNGAPATQAPSRCPSGELSNAGDCPCPLNHRWNREESRCEPYNSWAKPEAPCGCYRSGGEIADACDVCAAAREAFRVCYDEAVKTSPGMEGTVRLTLRVGAEGRVTSTTVNGAGLEGDLVNCVRGLAENLRFAPPEGGVAIVLLPVTFTAH